MKVNKGSWHYKVWCMGKAESHMWYYNERPTNLCSYFWNVVMKLLAMIVGTTSSLALVSIAVYLGFIKTYIGFIIIGGLLGIAVTVTILHFVGSNIVKRVDHWVGTRPPKPPKQPREPSLILAFLKAKKAKVCPQIEFTSSDAEA